MSSHPRSTGSIAVNSADHVVGIVSDGPIRVDCRGLFCAGGVIPLNAFPELNRSTSGECVFAAVLASISNGCPKFEANPPVSELLFATATADVEDVLVGLYSPKDFLIYANVFSNSSIRLFTNQHRSFFKQGSYSSGSFLRFLLGASWYVHSLFWA